jgi:hypothetical protein
MEALPVVGGQNHIITSRFVQVVMMVLGVTSRRREARVEHPLAHALKHLG